MHTVLVAAQALKSAGFQVDVQTMDWGAVTARRTRKDSPDQGGWSIYVTVAGEFDANSPINNAYIGAACGNSLPGWPCDKTLDELRSAWLRETEPAKRQQALDAVQRRAYEVLPYIAYGQYSAVLAARKEVCNTQALWRGIPSVWVLDK